MNKAAVIGAVAIGALALIVMEGSGGASPIPPPGVLPGYTGPWRRMHDDELVASEVAFANQMLRGHPASSEEIHDTSNGPRRWLREKSGGMTIVTVWRPSSDPYTPAGEPAHDQGGADSNGRGGGDTKPSEQGNAGL